MTGFKLRTAINCFLFATTVTCYVSVPKWWESCRCLHLLLLITATHNPFYWKTYLRLSTQASALFEIHGSKYMTSNAEPNIVRIFWFEDSSASVVTQMHLKTLITYGIEYWEIQGCYVLFLGGWWVGMWVTSVTVLTEMFADFLKFILPVVERVSRLGHYRFLLNSVQFISCPTIRDQLIGSVVK